MFLLSKSHSADVSFVKGFENISVLLSEAAFESISSNKQILVCTMINSFEAI